jgi:hypothetical protein
MVPGQAVSMICASTTERGNGGVLVIAILYICLRRDSESFGNDVTRRWKVSGALIFFYCFGSSSIAESLRAESLLACSICNEFFNLCNHCFTVPF